MPDNSTRKTVTFEELAYSNMLTVTALLDLLEENGLLQKSQVLDRVRRIQSEIEADKRSREGSTGQ